MSCHVLQMRHALPEDYRCTLWECLAQAEHSTFLPVCMAVWGFPEAYTRDQEGMFGYDPNRAADAFLRLDTLAELKRFVVDTYGVRQDVRPCYGAGVRAFWRAQEARLVAEWPRMLEEWRIRGKSGRNVATAQVNFNQVWTLADAKRLHDELAWYWTEFNCDLRDGGGAMDVPNRPFASSEVRKLVAESKDVFNGVEDEASLMTAKATMADIVRGIALYRQGVLGSEDNPWGSGESVFVWTNGTGALVFEVPAEGKQGFFYLMSKPAVSDVVD